MATSKAIANTVCQHFVSQCSGASANLLDLAAQGTIIHPSVYLVFDEHNTLFLASNALSFRNRIEQLRDTTLTKDVFWEEKEIVENTEPGAIRILVCGNTGVGKSTLINEVFGAELVGSHLRRMKLLR